MDNELRRELDEELRRELLARRDEDQRIRTLVTSVQGRSMITLTGEAAAEWQRIDQDNTRWLGELLDARGWPGPMLAGEDGAAAGRAPGASRAGTVR